MPGDDEIIIKRVTDPIVIKHTTEITKLQDLLKGNELLLEQTVREKANLEAENLNLKNEVQRKTATIQAFDKEKALLEDMYKKLNEADKLLIVQKEAEITKLRGQTEELTRTKNPDELLVKELTKVRLQFEELNLQHSLNMQELIEKKSNLAIGEEKIRKMTSDLENLNRMIADYQFEKVTGANELNLLRSKFKAAYTAEELSGYLNSAIDSFNSQVNTVDSAVNYIINGMDLDLKAQVYKDEQSRMMFTVADLASKSENSLSTIKISIRAVPKL